MLTAVVIAAVIIAMCGESFHCFIPSAGELKNCSSLKLKAYSHSYLHLKDSIRTTRSKEREEEKAEEKELEPHNRSGRRRQRFSETEISPCGDASVLSGMFTYRQPLFLPLCLILISSYLLIFILFIHSKDGLK